MKKIIQIKNINRSIYVYWIITDFCNQQCSYCPSNLHSGKFNKLGFPFKSDIDFFISTLIDYSKKKDKKIYLVISGGEPTTHPELPSIISRMAPYSFLEIITNGTRNVSWWQTLPALPNKVIITLHPEYYDSKKIRIKVLSDFLKENSVDFQFNLMCYPKHWDKVNQILDDIPFQFRDLVVPKVIQYQDTVKRLLYDYTEEQLNFIKTYPSKIKSIHEFPIVSVYSDNTIIKTNANKLMAANEHYFKDWKCSAGVNSISVFADGTVGAGICKSKRLGTIRDFNFLTEYIDCPRPSCTCPGDITLDKYYNNQ